MFLEEYYMYCFESLLHWFCFCVDMSTIGTAIYPTTRTLFVFCSFFLYGCCRILEWYLCFQSLMLALFYLSVHAYYPWIPVDYIKFPLPRIVQNNLGLLKLKLILNDILYTRFWSKCLYILFFSISFMNSICALVHCTKLYQIYLKTK